LGAAGGRCVKKYFGAGVLAMLASGAAFADQPVDRGIGFQPAATHTMQEIEAFHNLVLPIITVITLVVLALLLWTIVRYNSKANPVPKKFSHNTLVEVIWTVIPVIILVVIAIPSFRLLYLESRVPEKVDMTLKVVGYQWYWGYEYPDSNGVAIEGRMLPEADAKAAGKPRLLGTDNPVVVPVDKTVRVIVTAADVIHSWAMPAFGVKMDAVPGHTNETWFRANKVGTYYGQCSELCGVDHAFMPIEIRVVTQAEYDTWIAEQQRAQGLASAEPTAPPAAGTAPVTPASAPAPATPAATNL
jgi:cytochrome c oxidase subunit II